MTSIVALRRERGVIHQVLKFLVHLGPLFDRWNSQQIASSGTKNAASALQYGERLGGRGGDDKLQGRLIRQRDLYFFTAFGDEEEIGDVGFGVLGADLHGLRVV
jgi:hypothetical protein